MTHVDSENADHTLSLQDKDMEERVRLCIDAILMDDQIRQLKDRLKFIIEFCDRPIMSYCRDENGRKHEIIIGSTCLNKIRILEQEIFERTEAINRFYKI